MSNKNTVTNKPENQEESVVIPRFTGSDLNPVCRLLIQFTPPIAIIALIVMVLTNPEGVASVIFDMRTYVTSGYTWLFILYSLFLLRYAPGLFSASLVDRFAWAGLTQKGIQ